MILYYMLFHMGVQIPFGLSNVDLIKLMTVNFDIPSEKNLIPKFVTPTAIKLY